MTHIMIDLEALNSDSSGVLVSLGAVKFDLTNYELGATFYLEVSEKGLKDQIAKGRTINIETVIWWMQQSDEARKVFAKSEFKCTTEQLLGRFAEFCDKNDEVWGNGSDFDNVFLRSVYKTYNIGCPFTYSKNRCYRTFKNIFGNKAKLNREGAHHNGLDDAITQAKHLMSMHKAVTKGK